MPRRTAVRGALEIGTRGGDGGSPYAAPASPRGKYCDSGLPWISLLTGLVLAVGGGALAVGSRRWRPLLACATAGSALVLSPLAAGSVLSKECGDKPTAVTAEQYQRYLERHPECAHY